MIEIQNLYKHYGDKDEIRAVDGVSFNCPDGQITGLLGPNGAGKTTTLRMIVGLIKPKAGTVVVDGHDLDLFFGFFREFPKCYTALAGDRELIRVG